MLLRHAPDTPRAVRRRIASQQLAHARQKLYPPPLPQPLRLLDGERGDLHPEPRRGTLRRVALGGVAAQEALKAISGQFTPLRQWLYVDAAEAGPRADAPLPAADVAPTGSRYDGQVAVFGAALPIARATRTICAAGISVVLVELRSP